MVTRASVSIVGFAACTSVGYSLEASLAAMGAGLSNFTDTKVRNPFGEPVVAASLADSDMPRRERLAVLVQHGLDDVRSLMSSRGLRNAPLVVGVPSDLTAGEQEVLQTALQQKPLAWFPQGRASTFAALAAAADLLGRKSHRFVIVGGVDSLCDRATISRLMEGARLLGPYTEGTIPGEAAGFALLARTDDPIVDVSTSLRIEAIAQERATVPFTQVEQVSGDALAAAFRSLREGGATRVHRVIAAHSGEGYFGRSFAHAYLREADVMPEPLEVSLIADTVGDVGAAAGILGMAFSMYLMVKDARGDESRALIYSESDTGETGAAIIEGRPTSWQRDVAIEIQSARG